MLLRPIILVFFSFILLSCQENKKPRIAWYYWSTYAYNHDFRAFNQVHGKQILYVRLFDVKWHAHYGAYPEAKFAGNFSGDSSFSELVPVVYITNEALINTHIDSIPALHKKMKIEIDTEIGGYFGNYSVKEWQFDCDWTERSREKYFLLLSLFQKSEEVIISATVKLYQYAYREKAGIPPSDRAVLMCYNVSNPRDEKIVNSIFDAEEVKKYLKKADYPLPIDIALPNFNWAVWFRNGNFNGLLNGMDSTDLRNLPVKMMKPGYYVFFKNYEYNDDFFKEGDALRLEGAGPEEFCAIAKDLSKHLNDPKSTLILYNFEQFSYGKNASDSLFVDRLLSHF